VTLTQALLIWAVFIGVPTTLFILWMFLGDNDG
jgi:multisubunit Na+/H+ antiporter MnhC subunit